MLRLDGGDCDNSGTGIDGTLLRALVALFRRIAVVASRHEQLCRETYFVLRLLEQLVMCGRGSSQSILKHLPPSLVVHFNYKSTLPELLVLIYNPFSVAEFDTLCTGAVYCRSDIEFVRCELADGPKSRHQ